MRSAALFAGPPGSRRLRSSARRRSAALALVLGCSLGGTGSSAADTAPFISLREIGRLQDRIASGDAVAAAAHAKAIAQTAAQFAAAKPTVWADERNARALVLYLFSGGNATVIAKGIPPAAVAKAFQPLYEGALAYGLGEDDKARQNLLPIDAKSLPSGLGGHLALVQATLMAGGDRPAAIDRLDTARLLEPGTLVEEAVLRKELMLIDVGSGDAGKFVLLARRYIGTFPRSIYFANFRQVIGAAAMTLGASDTAAAGGRLEQIVDVLDKPDRCRLLLSVARDALLAGRFVMANFAGKKAQALAQKGSPEEARALVYLGAATIAGPQYEAGRRALDAADSRRLGAADTVLRQSALAVADMIRSPVFAATPVRGGDASVLTDGDRAVEAADAIVKLAEK